MTLWMLIGILVLRAFPSANGEFDKEDDRCEAAIKEVILRDRATAVDDGPSRLHSTWLSQECEVRPGPEYTIRKYVFFENGTFLLLRHYYAEESCSVATHTVTARGSIELATTSGIVPGATEAKFRLDAVHVVPLNRQVARKFGRRVNASCGPRAKWRAYVSQPIYEEPPGRSSYRSSYDSLQTHPPFGRYRGMNCLESLGIDFEELRLLRVQERLIDSATDREATARVELLLANYPTNIRWNQEPPTSLQSTALLRADTTNGCPICGSVSRGTEYSPPLLHEVAALPALIGGFWISSKCESHEGGLWSRRQLRIHSGDKLWTSRWDYHADPRCSILLYTITAAGSYEQRGHSQLPEFTGESSEDSYHRGKRSPEEDAYRHLLRDARPSMVDSFTAMLRGKHRQPEETARKHSGPPMGTTELDLHVAESILIPGKPLIPARCIPRTQTRAPVLSSSSWAKNCMPWPTIEAPSTLNLRAKVTIDWSGRYTLLLGRRDSGTWNPPLRRCGPTSPHNPKLRAHLKRSVDLRYGFLSYFTSSAQTLSAWSLFQQFAMCFLFYVLR